MNNQTKPQKKFMTALLLAAWLLLCLTGCDMGKQAAEKAREAARAPAEEAAREWLEQTLPGAELLSAEPYVFHRRGVSPYRLTELVSGVYRQDGREQAYWLNTADGEAWLEVDRETANALCAQCSAAVLEALGLSARPEHLEAAEGYAYFEIGTAEQIDVLPAAFVLSGASLERLVRDPASRPPLVVSFSCAVPDSASLSRLTLSDVLRAQEECGLQLFNVQLANRGETALLSEDRVTYKRLSDNGETALLREERLDAKTGEIIVEERAGTA